MVEKVNIEHRTVAACDGYSLGLSLFHPIDSQGAVVLIASATGVKRTYYEDFAKYLASGGFRVVTFDYRGIGDSRPEKLAGFTAYMHQWAEQDISGIITWVLDYWRVEKVIYIGHSVGGQLLPLAAQRKRIAAAYMVCAQSGYWRLWSGKNKVSVWIFAFMVVPLVSRFFGYFPGKFMGNSRDLPAGVAREWAAWIRNPEYVLSRDTRAREWFASLTIPMMFLSFSDDFFAPSRNVKTLASWYQNAIKSHHHRTPKEIGLGKMGHFGYFRKSLGGKLWPEVIDWLNGLSSGTLTEA